MQTAGIFVAAACLTAFSVTACSSGSTTRSIEDSARIEALEACGSLDAVLIAVQQDGSEDVFLSAFASAVEAAGQAAAADATYLELSELLNQADMEARNGDIQGLITLRSAQRECDRLFPGVG